MSYRFNSTIRIKNKPCKRCGRVGPIFSKGRCRSCSTIESTFARMEEETEKEMKEEGLSDLIDALDRLVSKYTRIKYADREGYVQCFTCATKKHWTLMQAGHFIPRGHLYLRFDTRRNLRPQCDHCNCMLHGNVSVFQKNLDEEQIGLSDILYEEARIVHKWDRSELKAMINEYTHKLKLLKQ